MKEMIRKLKTKKSEVLTDDQKTKIYELLRGIEQE